MRRSFFFIVSSLSACPASPASRKLLTTSFLFTFFASTPLFAVDELLGLGFLPGKTYSEAKGVNADGSVVVGWSGDSFFFGKEAFRWTPGGGMVGLGFLPGKTYSVASGINADGSVVVGTSGLEAFRWTAGGGMVGLGFLPGDDASVASGINADGSVVVGQSGREAFRWTASSGMLGLGKLRPDHFSKALDVNADGSVVVGWSGDSFFFGKEAFRWTPGGGMVGLGFLPGDDASVASGINADGSVVVGTSSERGFDPIAHYWPKDISWQAFRWTAGGGMVGLGFLPGDDASEAKGVNADGSVVVGWSNRTLATYIVGDYQAFRWTEAEGMHSVTDWLAEAGVPLVGWQLQIAEDVNADGTVVVGSGINPDGDPEAWLARNDGLIGLNTFAASLGSVVSTASLGTQLAGLALGGSHHQPLLAQNFLDGDNCAWINGDLGYYNRDRDADLALGEMGACHDFVPGQLRAGLGVGASRATEDLDFSGDTELDGQYLLAELDYRIPQSTVIASLTALAGEWDATIDRGYLNAGSPDQSRGKTDVDVTAVRVRLDWLDAYSHGDVTFSPRVEYTHFRTRADGYTEKGGGFPAHYDSRSDTISELRIGGNAEMGLSETAYLRGMLEGVHRFDDEGPRLSGDVIGLFGFSLPGEEFRQDWMRAGIELGSRISTNAAISVSVNASTKGEDPDYSGGLSLQATF